MSTSVFVETNGVRLHYLDYGNPGAPPLICLHGLSGNAHHFDYLAPHLAPAWHVMSVDVRGRGDSAWGPPGDYHQQIYMADLVGLLDALEIPRVSLIGTSMGGVISMMLAGFHPARVARLVLNDIGPEIDKSGLGRINEYMTSSPSSFASIEEVAQYYLENYPTLRHVPGPALREFVQWSVRPTDDGRLVWKLDPAIRNIPRAGAAARPMDLWMPYARITAPVLVIRGALSDILSRATTDRMRVVQRKTEVVEVPGVGHAPSLTEPEALAAIKQFLA